MNATRLAPPTILSAVARRLRSKLNGGVAVRWTWPDLAGPVPSNGEATGPGGGGAAGAGMVTGAPPDADAGPSCAPQFVQKSAPSLTGAWQLGHIAASSALGRLVEHHIVVGVRRNAGRDGRAAYRLEGVVAVDLDNRRPGSVLIRGKAARIVDRRAVAVGGAGQGDRVSADRSLRPVAAGKGRVRAVPVDRDAERGTGARHLSESVTGIDMGARIPAALAINIGVSRIVYSRAEFGTRAGDRCQAAVVVDDVLSPVRLQAGVGERMAVVVDRDTEGHCGTRHGSGLSLSVDPDRITPGAARQHDSVSGRVDTDAELGGRA